MTVIEIENRMKEIHNQLKAGYDFSLILEYNALQLRLDELTEG